jgi:hypothetical protein
MGIAALNVALALCAGALCAQEFHQHTIATDLKGGYQVVATDMNNDGRLDLIALASGMPELVWYENPGWQRHVIAGPFSRMINVGAHDIDGDGIPELVLAHGFSNEAKNSVGIVSVLRHRGNPRERWDVKEIDRLTTSHRIRWADLTGSGWKVAVNAPLTGTLLEGSTPLVFYDPRDWKRQTIPSGNRGVVHGVLIADWDEDGRDDVLTASFLGIHVHSPGREGRWRRAEISKGDPSPWPKGGSSDIAIARAGSDRYLTAIEPWHGNQVVIYTPKRTVIDTALADGHTIVTADFDDDGNDEIVAGCRGGPKSVFLYRYNGGKWQKKTVDGGGIAAAACTAADLNGDGRPDLACIGSATANLKWYENVPPPAQSR